VGYLALQVRGGVDFWESPVFQVHIQLPGEQLVKLLGQDAQQNSETLARRLNLSAATVSRRLRKLIRSELLHIVGVVDPNNFGFPLAAVITLDVAHDKLESAMEALAKLPEIKWVSTTTGRFDIIALAR